MKRTLTADLAIVGAGSGGLSIAAGAAQLGVKVVLFERAEMGGDCLNAGCVPSKALLAAAKAAQHVRVGGLGGRAQEPQVDFAAVMTHVRGTIEAIAPVDSQARFEGLGVTVVREHAAFADPRTLESDSVRVTARRIVLAAGSRPVIPPVPGLAETPHLTNETVWRLDALPERLLILGGGPIGVELGQAFRRLGSEVVIVEPERALGREDPAAAAVVLDRLRAENVELRQGLKATGASTTRRGLRLTLSDGEALEGSHILVAAGRAPTTERLNLEAAGVAYDKAGVRTDKALRTSNRRVFAVGDVAGRGAWTHLAGAHAALFVRHALFAAPVDAGKLVVPRVTYTDPELAAVGLSEAEARTRHGDVRVVEAPFEENDRARAEGAPVGFGKLILSPGGKPLGVVLVGQGAGELIAPWALVLAGKLKLADLASSIAPYPTRAEINKRLAGLVYSPRLFSPGTRKLVSLLKHVR